LLRQLHAFWARLGKLKHKGDNLSLLIVVTLGDFRNHHLHAEVLHLVLEIDLQVFNGLEVDVFLASLPAAEQGVFHSGVEDAADVSIGAFEALHVHVRNFVLAADLDVAAAEPNHTRSVFVNNRNCRLRVVTFKSQLCVFVAQLNLELLVGFPFAVLEHLDLDVLDFFVGF